MRIAIPKWQGRVSPVFDVATTLLFAEVGDDQEITGRDIALVATDPLERVRQIAVLETDVLICGAISWDLEMALSSAGVRVIPYICGSVEEVLAAFQNGTLTQGAFVMPGCCGRRRRVRRGRPTGLGERGGR